MATPAVLDMRDLRAKLLDDVSAPEKAKADRPVDLKPSNPELFATIREGSAVLDFSGRPH